MAKFVVVKCDRCGREAEKSTRITRYNTDHHGTDIDLCHECWRILWDWLQGSSAPIVYKRRMRPCPHNIPCADSYGCSGYELIPA